MAEYWLRYDGKELGPISAAAVRLHATSGEMPASAEIRQGDDGQWRSVTRIRGFVARREPDDVSVDANQSKGQAEDESDRVSGLTWGIVGAAIAILVCLGLYAIAGILGSGSTTLTSVKRQSEPAPRDKKSKAEPRVADASSAPPSLAKDVQPLSAAEIINRCDVSVVLIEGKNSRGTGFFVAADLIVTNRHVIEQELIEDVEVQLPANQSVGGSRVSPSLYYRDPKLDLAFLSIKAQGQALSLDSDSEFQRGKEVVIIGNPGVGPDLQLRNAISRGLMSTEAEFEGKKIWQLDIAVNAGNSGGPVVDDRGRVLGVVTMRGANTDGLGFAIPASDVARSLRRALESSPEDRARQNSVHRVEVLVFRIEALTAPFDESCRSLSERVANAIRLGASPDAAFATMRNAMDVPERQAVDRVHTRRLLRQVRDDELVPVKVRRTIDEMWQLHGEVEALASSPGDDLDRFATRFKEIRDRLLILHLSARIYIDDYPLN